MRESKLWEILCCVLILAVIIVLYVGVLKGKEQEHMAPEETIATVPVNLSELEVLSEPSIEETTVQAVEMTPEQLAEEEYYDSLETLAICVEAEAGNQDLLGKKLVVDVILNRVDSEDFPDDINSVISDKNQFSSYTDGGMARVWEPSEETFQAVREELENRTDSNILYFTAGCYNQYCVPAYQHGAHYFGY